MMGVVVLFGIWVIPMGVWLLRNGILKWRRPREMFDKEQERRQQQHDVHVYTLKQNFEDSLWGERAFQEEHWSPEQQRAMRKQAVIQIVAGGSLVALVVISIVVSVWLGR